MPEPQLYSGLNDMGDLWTISWSVDSICIDPHKYYSPTPPPKEKNYRSIQLAELNCTDNNEVAS